MRKAEVEVIEKLLHEPHEDAAELARAIIKALDAFRAASEQPYYIVVRGSLGGSLVQSFGPFRTRAEADRAVQSGRLSSIDAKIVYSPLYGMKYAEQVLEKVDSK